MLKDADPRVAERFQGDVRRLERDLRRAVRGEVRFDGAVRALYATDGSNYRLVPLGLVVPRTVKDVVRAVEVCHAHDAPIVHRGGGTSLAGQTCNRAVVIDGSKHLTRVLDLDRREKTVKVEPGLVLDHLNRRVKALDLAWAPDPSTHGWCTFGGMLGNNSCGVHSQMAGRTEQNVLELEILTYDGLRATVGATSEEELLRLGRQPGRLGEIYRSLRELRDRRGDVIRARTPDLPRRVSGYNLLDLLPERGCHVARALVGSEGTLVTLLSATLRLVDWPRHRVVLALGYPDVYQAADHLPEVLECGPMGLEGLDARLVDLMRRSHLYEDKIHFLPRGGGWLLAEFGGATAREAEDKARRCEARLKASREAPTVHLVTRPEDQESLWKVREAGLSATAHPPGESDTWEGWEDSAVPPERMGEYLRGLRRLYEKYRYQAALYGHFGQGCVHTRIDFDLRSREGVAKFRSFLGEAADLCLGLGGSLSGEHGDGQSRAELLPRMYGPEMMEAFREFKRIWDPGNRMNPGRIVDPDRLDENLRLGADFRPPYLQTHFAYEADGGRFTHATMRCVGVGKCRRTEVEAADESMCPSYMVTRDEMHSTRGRARMLFEMIRGPRRPWADDGVKEALDLCLACKGCKHDCPVSVDMAQYKAEFLAHYYQERRRPRTAWSMGWIQYWARLASLAPGLVNLVTQTPLLGDLARLAAGIAPQRRIPPFASVTFRKWFEGRPVANPRGPRVLLWPDTFTDHFRPETGRAAVEVLERGGFRVEIPDRWLCCGRPLYDYGFLDLAKDHWRDILEALAPAIQDGLPLVGLEPSCVAAFRDELVHLFPHDPDARRLSRQTFTLAEFLARRPDYRPPRLQGKVVFHGHCHQKAVMGIAQDQALLGRTGLEVEALKSGCCGMAGSFGFEAEHYDLSMKCGEHALLPAVRQAPREAAVLADGFSCREQIASATDRRALHLAEILYAGLDGDLRGPLPEREVLRKLRGPFHRSPLPGLALAAAAVAGGWLWWSRRREER